MRWEAEIRWRGPCSTWCSINCPQGTGSRVLRIIFWNPDCRKKIICNYIDLSTPSVWIHDESCLGDPVWATPILWANNIFQGFKRLALNTVIISNISLASSSGWPPLQKKADLLCVRWLFLFPAIHTGRKLIQHRTLTTCLYGKSPVAQSGVSLLTQVAG